MAYLFAVAVAAGRLGGVVMALFDMIGRAIGLVDELVEDKDKAAELKSALELAKNQAYITELQTVTIPWVDALHKMGRQILSFLQLIIPACLLLYNPHIDPQIFLYMSGPAGIYNWVKGKGR